MAETIWIGALELRFLHSKETTAGSLDLFEMDVPPRARMPVPHHHRDWDETVYGLSGVLTFTVDGRTTEIGPGDHLFIPRGAVHGFDNRGEAVATCLSVLTPGVLGPGYFRELASLVAAGPPDPEVMKAVMLRHGLIPAPPT
jgi:quercetin dioxygenase-like cupin family protein